MKIYFIVPVLLALAVLVQADTYLKEVNKADPEALCLDGQPAFLYYQQGAPTPTEGLIIYFMAPSTALYCGNSSLPTSLDSCLLAQAEVTSFWTDKLSIGEGILVQKRLAEWGKVIIPHCDGALFQGYAKSAVKYKNKDLYFRGNRIIKSHLQQISKKFNLTKLANVVVAGSGIGAIGAVTWARYFRDEYASKNAYELVLDSFPQSYLSFRSGKNQYQASLQNLLKLANVDESHPYVLCALRNEGQEYKCFTFQEAYSYLNFPIMAVDSQYDLFTIIRVLEIGCVSEKGLGGCSSGERQYIEKYRSEKLVGLFRFVNWNDKSFWSIACPASTLLNNNYDSSTFSIWGTKVSQAVISFIFGSRTINYDRYSWPSNTNCAIND